MNQISLKNLNKPTSAKWGKIQAACMFVSTSITGTALVGDNHVMAWAGWGLTIVAGLIPIFVNGGDNQEKSPG